MFPPLRPSLLAVLIAGIAPATWATGALTDLPISIDADQSSGKSGEMAEVHGNVVIEQGNMKLESDWARYQIQQDRVEAGDAFKMTREGNTVSGKKIDMLVSKREGEVTDPVFVMAGERARGDARQLLLEGPERYAIRDGRFTTCPVNNDDWYIHAGRLDLDYNTQIGQAWGGWLEFKGTPVFYYPWIDFPLDGGRKSGLLSPYFGFDGDNGFSIQTPFYWNIAPNYDATISPRYFRKRGTMLGGEFRYLGETFSSQVRGERINDLLTGQNRFSEIFQHQQTLAPNLQLSINVQKVSDDNYLADYGDRLSVSSQTNLPREGLLSYSGNQWSSFLRWQRFQTLQTASDPVETPYARVPQFYFTANPEVKSWLQPSVSGELTKFSLNDKACAAGATCSWSTGTRSWVYPSLSLPLQDTYGFFTPKIGMHATRYNLEDKTKTSTSFESSSRNVDRVLPIASVDSGLFFERETSIGGSSAIQTFEPRAYYLYIPYRKQSSLPLFDTGESDLSFSQLFSENQFSGQDRINDANQLTLAATSRLLNKDTGAESVRATIGQRFYLDSQQVTLTSTSGRAGERRSDSLLSVGAQMWQGLQAEYDLQYSFQNNQTRRSSTLLSWGTEAYKRINLRYTMNRVASSGIEQLDLSGQWPLTQNVYVLGKENYSLRDQHTLEALLGVEYNAGCWAIRLAGQRYITTDQTYKSRYFMVLELGGIAGLGNNPLDAIKQAIPGYSNTYDVPSLTKSK